MNLAQTMLSAAALVVLTVLVMNAHRLVIYSSDETIKAEARDMAVNVAQSLINEISRKQFDQNVSRVYMFNSPPSFPRAQATTDFTQPWDLGPESGSVVNPLPDVAPFKSDSVYNDVDDYHGYRRIVDTEHVKALRCSVIVVYVPNRDSPDTAPSSVRTYVKRVDVFVMHPSVPEKLRFRRLIVY